MTSSSPRNSPWPSSVSAQAVTIGPSVRDRPSAAAGHLDDAQPRSSGKCQTLRVASNAVANEWTVDRIYVRIVWRVSARATPRFRGLRSGVVWGSAPPGPRQGAADRRRQARPVTLTGGRRHERDRAGAAGPRVPGRSGPGGAVGAGAARIRAPGPCRIGVRLVGGRALRRGPPGRVAGGRRDRGGARGTAIGTAPPAPERLGTAAARRADAGRVGGVLCRGRRETGCGRGRPAASGIQPGSRRAAAGRGYLRVLGRERAGRSGAVAAATAGGDLVDRGAR